MPELWNDPAPEHIIAGRKVLDHVKAAIMSLPMAERAALLPGEQQDIDASDVWDILNILEGNMRGPAAPGAAKQLMHFNWR